MIDRLNIISYLSPNLFWFYEAVSQYLSRNFQISVQIRQGCDDPLTDLLQQSELDIAFVCGLPFIQSCHITPNQFQAIAAPVMQSNRYQNRPIYFSDVIVNANSSITKFEQLSGKCFCFNDPGSNSGYNLMRYRLSQGKCPLPFFGKVIQSGSHQQSIRWVVEQKADCAAIDSVVLEQELRQSPKLAQLRIIESIGPNPMPPIVAAHRLGQSFLAQLRSALLHPDAELCDQMQQVEIRRFAPVQTADYEVVYQVYQQTSCSQYDVIR